MEFSETTARPTAHVERSASDDSFVEFANVQKTYDGETLVIKNLNLTIRRGEYTSRAT